MRQNSTKILLSGLVLSSFLLSACADVQNGNVDEYVDIAPSMTVSSGEDGGVMVANSAEFVKYDDSRYEDLLGKKPFMLFFHADWCPTCLAIESNIMSELSEFPENAVVLEVNYDNASELKREYSVNTQSVFVVIDENGDHVETLSAPSNKEIISSFNSIL